MFSLVSILLVGAAAETIADGNETHANRSNTSFVGRMKMFLSNKFHKKRPAVFMPQWDGERGPFAEGDPVDYLFDKTSEHIDSSFQDTKFRLLHAIGWLPALPTYDKSTNHKRLLTAYTPLQSFQNDQENDVSNDLTLSTEEFAQKRLRRAQPHHVKSSDSKQSILMGSKSSSADINSDAMNTIYSPGKYDLLLSRHTVCIIQPGYMAQPDDYALLADTLNSQNICTSVLINPETQGVKSLEETAKNGHRLARFISSNVPYFSDLVLIGNGLGVIFCRSALQMLASSYWFAWMNVNLKSLVSIDGHNLALYLKDDQKYSGFQFFEVGEELETYSSVMDLFEESSLTSLSGTGPGFRVEAPPAILLSFSNIHENMGKEFHPSFRSSTMLVENLYDNLLKQCQNKSGTFLELHPDESNREDGTYVTDSDLIASDLSELMAHRLSSLDWRRFVINSDPKSFLQNATVLAQIHEQIYQALAHRPLRAASQPLPGVGGSHIARVSMPVAQHNISVNNVCFVADHGLGATDSQMGTLTDVFRVMGLPKVNAASGNRGWKNLDGLEETSKRLAQYIQRVCKPGNDLYLLGFSFGGIHSRYALTILRRRGWFEQSNVKYRGLILVSSPNAGAVWNRPIHERFLFRMATHLVQTATDLLSDSSALRDACSEEAVQTVLGKGDGFAAAQKDIKPLLIAISAPGDQIVLPEAALMIPTLPQDVIDAAAKEPIVPIKVGYTSAELWENAQNKSHPLFDPYLTYLNRLGMLPWERYIVAWHWGPVHGNMLTPMLSPVVNFLAERLKYDITGQSIPMTEKHYVAREATFNRERTSASLFQRPTVVRHGEIPFHQHVAQESKMRYQSLQEFLKKHTEA